MHAGADTKAVRLCVVWSKEPCFTRNPSQTSQVELRDMVMKLRDKVDIMAFAAATLEVEVKRLDPNFSWAQLSRRK